MASVQQTLVMLPMATHMTELIEFNYIICTALVQTTENLIIV